MRKRIRDLDFAEITGEIMRSTNVATRKSADWITQDVLGLVNSKTDAARVLRGTIAVAAVSKVQSPTDLTFEQPLVGAFVIAHRHPLVAPLALGRLDTDSGIDCGPRLLEIAGAHPDVGFSLADLEQALIDAIRVYGDHEVDDTAAPWSMHWNGAVGAAGALILFVTLQALGDIAVSWDAAEKHEYDEAVEHFERTKSIRPLKLE